MPAQDIDYILWTMIAYFAIGVPVVIWFMRQQKMPQSFQDAGKGVTDPNVGSGVLLSKVMTILVLAGMWPILVVAKLLEPPKS